MRASAERVADRWLSRVAGVPTWEEVAASIKKIQPTILDVYKLDAQGDLRYKTWDTESKRNLGDFVGNGQRTLEMWSDRYYTEGALSRPRQADPNWFNPAKLTRPYPILEWVQELSGNKSFVRDYKAFWKLFKAWTGAGYPMT